jgi:ParB family chromosome partitioning protein
MKQKPTLQQISIDLLIPGKYQPRRYFDPALLQELADSIKTMDGLLQPIVARKLPLGKFEIVAGERRWRAAQLAGLNDVSCLVSEYTDEQALQASLIENISRSDLNPIEEAQAYQRLIDEFHYLHEEVAATVGKSRTVITNMLRLLKLDNRVQNLLITGQLSEGHGKILAGLNHNQQFPLAQLCVDKGWSVRKIESEVKKQQAIETNNVYSDPNIKVLETALSEYIGNQININYEDRGGGYVKMRFNNIDELEGYFDKIGFKIKRETE